MRRVVCVTMNIILTAFLILVALAPSPRYYRYLIIFQPCLGFPACSTTCSTQQEASTRTAVTHHHPLFRRRQQGKNHRTLLQRMMSSSSSKDNKSNDNDSLFPSIASAKQQEEALDAIKSCYEMALVSALVDTAVNWATWLQQSSHAAVYPLWRAFAPGTIWKFAFFIGIKFASDMYKNTGKVVLSKDDMDVVKKVSMSMAAVWRVSAWVIIATQLISASALAESERWVSVAVGTAAVLGSLVVRWFSFQETKLYTLDSSSSCSSSCSSIQDNGRRTGLLAARNMALCVGALLLQGFVSPLIVFLEDLSWIQRVLSLSGVATPFVTAGLLWSLRKGFLAAVIVSTEDEDTSKAKKEPLSIYMDLFEAQKKFYSKVASTLKAEVVFKVLFTLVAFASKHLKLSGGEL